jgi:hypothetical protein
MDWHCTGSADLITLDCAATFTWSEVKIRTTVSSAQLDSFYINLLKLKKYIKTVFLMTCIKFKEIFKTFLQI